MYMYIYTYILIYVHVHITCTYVCFMPNHAATRVCNKNCLSA